MLTWLCSQCTLICKNYLFFSHPHTDVKVCYSVGMTKAVNYRVTDEKRRVLNRMGMSDQDISLIQREVKAINRMLAHDDDSRLSDQEIDAYVAAGKAREEAGIATSRLSHFERIMRGK